MTNADRIVAEIATAPGSSDGELRQRTGIDPHQQVNQICRRLAADGRIVRRTRPDGVIGNYPADHEVRTVIVSSPQVPAPRPTPPSRLLNRTGALVVLPCSASKRHGGSSLRVGRAAADLLQPATAQALVAARNRQRSAANVDESGWKAAWQRYDGTLYNATRRLGQALAAGQQFVILSGGYGIVFADEPIGEYDRRFSLRDWPKGLLESCLEEIVERAGATSVVSFCARSTDYAELVRRIERRATVPVVHVSANLEGRGGAMVLAPRAAGEALDAFLNNSLADGWRGSDGVRVDVTQHESGTIAR